MISDLGLQLRSPIYIDNNNTLLQASTKSNMRVLGFLSYTTQLLFGVYLSFPHCNVVFFFLYGFLCRKLVDKQDLSRYLIIQTDVAH